MHHYEQGTLIYVFKKVLVKSALVSYHVETPTEADIYRKCISDSQENMKKNAHISMRPVQFKLLFVCYFFILLLALAVLLFEMWRGRASLNSALSLSLSL